MLRLRKIFLILILVLLAAEASSLVVFAKKKRKPNLKFRQVENFSVELSPALEKKYQELENISSAEQYKIYANKDNFKQNLNTANVKLDLLLDASSLIDVKYFPSSIAIKIYKIIDDQRRLISVLRPTVFARSQASLLRVRTSLIDVQSSSNLEIDLFSSLDKLKASFKLDIEIENAVEASFTELSESDCTGNFGKCHLKYLFEKVKFTVNPSKELKTEVRQSQDGSYFVNLPLYKSKSVKVPREQPVKPSNDQSALNVKDGETTFAEIIWDVALSAVTVDFPGISNNIFSVGKSGTVNVGTLDSDAFLSVSGGDTAKASLKLGAGSLAALPVDGALEYDGSKLYFTVGNTRTEIGSGQSTAGPAGPPGSTGPQGPAGAAGTFNPSGETLNGPMLFTANGMLQDANFNGDVTLATNIEFVGAAMIVDKSIVFDELFVNTSGTTVTVDWNEGNKQTITLAHAVTTVNFTDPAGPASLVLVVKQDGTGSRTVTGWPAAVKWPNGTAPTFSTAASSIDAVSCLFDGSIYMCQAGLNFQ